jgi:heat shock protein HslJ
MAHGAAARTQDDLVGVYWKAVELAGTPVPAMASSREPHLQLDAGGRFSGADGCNRMTGGYTLKGNGIMFGQMASTQMACADTEDLARRFRSALKGTSHWSMVNSRLQLLGATGKPLAVFEKGTPGSANSPLQGTTWQLVKFQGGDGAVLRPDDPAKYTLEFASEGKVNVRVDCNRGGGSWKATGPSLELGPLALTRAQCPPGSLHDHIVRQWASIRSFVVKDGHLFLALMADGGIYEFEPRVSKP